MLYCWNKYYYYYCKLILSHQVRSYQYFVRTLQACPLTPGQVISILCVHSASLSSHTRSGHINTLCALCKLVLSHQVRSYQYFVCALQACRLTPGQVISILCVHSASLSSHTRSGHINTLCALCKLVVSHQVRSYQYFVCTLQAYPLTPGQVISIVCAHSASLSSHTRSGNINTLCALCKLVVSHQVRSYQYFVCTVQACPLTPGQVISILCVCSASLSSHTRSGHINTLCALCKLVVSHQVRSYQYFVCALQACRLTPGQVISILCVHSASLSSHTRSGHVNMSY